MTSEQIQSATEDSKNPAGWLKEIAYQLAKLNEQMIQQRATNTLRSFDAALSGKSNKSPSKQSHK